MAGHAAREPMGLGPSTGRGEREQGRAPRFLPAACSPGESQDGGRLVAADTSRAKGQGRGPAGCNRLQTVKGLKDPQWLRLL